MEHWYAVHTRPKAERKATLNLENQGYKTYFPRHCVTSVRRNKRAITIEPLFPGYLFVSFDIELRRWRSINSTFGVKRLVGVVDAPLPIPIRLIDEIRAREDEQGFVTLSAHRNFQNGELVQLIEGPLLGAAGVFDCETGEDRVTILLSLLGREAKVKVSRRSIIRLA